MGIANGDRVRLIRDIDYEPYATIHQGETGVVTEIEKDGSGLVSVVVRLDREHEGLALWKNTVYLEDPELQAIAPEKRNGIMQLLEGAAAVICFGAHHNWAGT